MFPNDKCTLSGCPNSHCFYGAWNPPEIRWANLASNSPMCTCLHPPLFHNWKTVLRQSKAHSHNSWIIIIIRLIWTDDDALMHKNSSSGTQRNIRIRNEVELNWSVSVNDFPSRFLYDYEFSWTWVMNAHVRWAFAPYSETCMVGHLSVYRLYV